MHAMLLKMWHQATGSYWMVPSLMALGAVLLSIGTIAVDTILGEGWMNRIQWMYANKPEGARAVLSTIAGSMITVAGVTFSITIASVVYASSSYGPRILGNFMRNRGNQVTLGTFIATFLYCLLILRTVRSAEDLPPGAPESASATPAFIPHVSILVGIALAVVSTGVLIYFIHHIAASIHLPNVVASIAQEAESRLDKLYPERIAGRPVSEEDRPVLPAGFEDESVPVSNGGQGYIQTVDSELLLRLACKHDLIVRVEHRPGHFISRPSALLRAWPASRVNDGVGEALLQAFTWGTQRTAHQDVLFPVDELVEIAARALSPGINDPYTAMNCLDWLAGLLSQMARRAPPDIGQYDEAGTLRVVAEPVRLSDLAEAVFGQLLPYFAPDRNAGLHMMQVLLNQAKDETGQHIPDPIRRYAESLHSFYTEHSSVAYDRKEMDRLLREIHAALGAV